MPHLRPAPLHAAVACGGGARAGVHSLRRLWPARGFPCPWITHQNPLFAVLILDDICHPAQPPVATNFSIGRGMEPSLYLADVAFFNGKLYGVAFDNELVVFEIDYDLGRKLKISATECIINSVDDLRDRPQSLSSEEVYTEMEYLVQYCGISSSMLW